MNRKKHSDAVVEFLKNTLDQYDKYITYTWGLNDEEEDKTAYEVVIRNTTNSTLTCVVLRSDGETIEIIKGDEFYETDETDFFAYLFLLNFLTLVES